ncbi:MAG TPA: response regulator transcription factor [Gaiellaceae bacterium]|nr:response regulator transcription factor [Gaiellaceae bacterium]
MISVLIVDDQALVRSGFRLILDAQDDMEVVGEAADGRAAIEEAARLHPDVVLMDVRMPEVDGIAATRTIVGERPLARVLVLTTFDEDRIVYDAMKAGASGFLLKSAPPAQFVEAVRTVASGEALLAPSVTRRLVEDFVRRPPPGDGAPDQALRDLTEREREVLELIGRGLSNSEIAAKLFVSGATVKTHVNRILSKLGLRDRVQAVVVAYETGLVRPGE